MTPWYTFTMIHIIESFGCGLAFAMGITSFFFIRDLATKKGRAEIKNEMTAHAKRVEDRLAVQISAMQACLSAIEARKTK
jgi:MFS superfamily sulfate permease-like transporter